MSARLLALHRGFLRATKITYVRILRGASRVKVHGAGSKQLCMLGSAEAKVASPSTYELQSKLLKEGLHRG